MEKRIIDLEIIDELEGSGVDAIALVDSPAIEKNFMYFKAEEFVEPTSGESQSDYMGRCVPVLIGEGKDQDQAVAICISTYENMGKQEMGIDTGGLAPYTNQSGPLKRKAVALHKMLFADEDKKEIVAIAMLPDMEIPRKDKDGNIYFVRFSKEVIAKIAEKYMREQRLADTNIQHVDSEDAGAYVFESWIVETNEDKANSVYGLGAPIGAWCVKLRVTNPETWKKVKSGELKGLSIQGDFLDKNEYDAYMKDKKMYEDLVRLVKTL